ncbi:hypothetical protein LAZ67_18001739 [Cordylochernes scorpioides]|uniref:Mos1 transposase HTH domain-containing protein n=1 Tax=Cordylochernes scorpioides TaxID=51811 RepID=A0ABY6LKS8_9ARAC|nr:hypothetical protein LAZ67_18001739 [Cordylochernes scorpioides]
MYADTISHLVGSYDTEAAPVLFKTLELMNEANEDENLSRTQVYFWYKRFKDGRKSMADDSRSGRPLTSTTDRNIRQVRDLIVADRMVVSKKKY